jgi:tripartite-type tricarboxylate transporter receptor subunit TctC
MKRGIVAFAMLLAAAAAPALAQGTYPDKPIRVVVPFGAGSGPDTLTRLITSKMQPELGQTFVIENRPGAGGAIGTAYGKTLAADGYNLTMVGSPAIIAQEIRKDPGFDIFTDFVPIGAMTEFVNVMVVSGKVAANTVAEFVAEAKRNPGKLNCASAGISTPGHLACETFNARHGVEMVHVPFTSTPQALPALINGEVHVAFFVAPEVLQHVQGGAIKALSMTRDVRWPPLPQTPLASAADVRLNVGGWIGLMSPVGTPPAIVARLNAVLQKALAAPDVQEAAVRAGGGVLLGGPEKLGEVAARERVEVKAAVAAAKIEKQ